MLIVVTLYCLGNNDKREKSIMFSTDVILFAHICNPQLAQFLDAEPGDTENQLYLWLA
jgi:hypothetical protein